MLEAIRIKPHHFVDILAELADGPVRFEPSPYGHAVHTVARRLLADRNAVLMMELGADDICEPCIHNAGGLCDDVIDTSFRPNAPQSKREYNLLIDKRWCEHLALKQGMRLTAREFAELLLWQDVEMGLIYRELPADRVSTKARRIRLGARSFLEGDAATGEE